MCKTKSISFSSQKQIQNATYVLNKFNQLKIDIMNNGHVFSHESMFSFSGVPIDTPIIIRAIGNSTDIQQFFSEIEV